MSSQWEELLASQINFSRLEAPVREYMFARAMKRRWRLDFAWPLHQLGLEIDGGIWKGSKGRHTSGTGVIADCEKVTTAAILGWRIMRVTPLHVRTGQALQWVEDALKNSRETLERSNCDVYEAKT